MGVLYAAYYNNPERYDAWLNVFGKVKKVGVSLARFTIKEIQRNSLKKMTIIASSLSGDSSLLEIVKLSWNAVSLEKAVYGDLYARR